MRSLNNRAFAILLIVFAFSTMAAPAFAGCVTIQSGTLVYQPTHYLAGQPITTGVNPYGYNYQAHSFSGSLFNAYAGGNGLPPYDGNNESYLAANPLAAGHWAWQYRNVDLAMKWNDTWLANRDCDGDGLLDRHFGFLTYSGSGAWLTNHQSWTVTVDGKDFHARDFVKIVANPTGSYIGPPASYFGEQTVYMDGGQVVGAQIWGEFSAIQYVVNDPGVGDRGVLLKSQVAAGFGKFQP